MFHRSHSLTASPTLRKLPPAPLPGSNGLQEVTPLTQPVLFPLLCQQHLLGLAETYQPSLCHTHSHFVISVSPASNTLFFNLNIIQRIYSLPISSRPHLILDTVSEHLFFLNSILSHFQIQLHLK